MVPMMQRLKIKVLVESGKFTHEEVAKLVDVSVSSVQRVLAEGDVVHVDDVAERKQRRIGRPSKTKKFEDFVRNVLEKEPHLQSKELLRRAKQDGYEGTKSAFFELVAAVRPKETRVEMRFDGVAGEFSQHDFGEVRISFSNGTTQKVVFFASRLKYSRFVAISIVPDQTAESLVRSVCAHCERFGGVPLRSVFDRPRTVASAWHRDGTVTRWNHTFAQACFEIGFMPELCWPYQPQQKGSVENLVGWVKNSFFKQRVFHDMVDLQAQLADWHDEVNVRTASRATGVVPAVRLAEEAPRLRPLRITSADFALREPVLVGPTGMVTHHGHDYSMPAAAVGISGTLYLYETKVKIVAGRFEAVHPRLHEKGAISRLPEHRASQLAAVAGQRGKRYLKRQQIFELGNDAAVLVTELVHRHAQGGWVQEIDILHELFKLYGAEPLRLAMRAAVEMNRPTVDYVRRCLGEDPSTPLQQLNFLKELRS